MEKTESDLGSSYYSFLKHLYLFLKKNSCQETDPRGTTGKPQIYKDASDAFFSCWKTTGIAQDPINHCKIPALFPWLLRTFGQLFTDFPAGGKSFIRVLDCLYPH